MARLRSWLGSGFALPPRTRESGQSPRRRERRERKLARHLAQQAGGRVKIEGKGWEYPLTASLGGFRADVRYEAAGAPLGVVTNICFMPTSLLHGIDKKKGGGYIQK